MDLIRKYDFEGAAGGGKNWRLGIWGSAEGRGGFGRSIR
jgi:hypothetical protein